MGAAQRANKKARRSGAAPAPTARDDREKSELEKSDVVFDAREYNAGEVRRVTDEDGTQRQALLYHHRIDGTVVLWFGGDEYEGIGAGYTYRGRILRDGDGETIPSRVQKRRGVVAELQAFLLPVGRTQRVVAAGPAAAEAVAAAEEEREEGGQEEEDEKEEEEKDREEGRAAAAAKLK